MRGVWILLLLVSGMAWGQAPGRGSTERCRYANSPWGANKRRIAGERCKCGLRSAGGSEPGRNSSGHKNSSSSGAGHFDQERARGRSRLCHYDFPLCGERSHFGAGWDLHPGKNFPRRKAGSVDQTGGTFAALHVHDLSQRIYRHVARVCGEHAGRG